MTIESGWCEIELPETGAAILELHGELDMATIEKVTSAFEYLTARDRDVVLDFSTTSFVDSAVLHAIFGFGRRQRDAGRWLVLQVRTEAVVRRVLEVAGLLDGLPWAENREQAIALTQRPRPTA